MLFSILNYNLFTTQNKFESMVENNNNNNSEKEPKKSITHIYSSFYSVRPFGWFMTDPICKYRANLVDNPFTLITE